MQGLSQRVRLPLVNVVVLVGVVRDRPFRPGNDRCVLKIAVDHEGSVGTDLIEVDVFGGVGEFVMNNVLPGDLVAIRGRLEDRQFSDGTAELRVVAHRVNRIRTAAPRTDRADREVLGETTEVL
ncbi:MAG: hypothetical protein KatS3mg008_0909 [Acidimicrobiales bacterium]|nr:MAG: hypothetical protein KatS3mg008_0909 [Acidimicrobiales bacterium]